VNAPGSPKAAAARNGSNNYRTHATEIGMFNFVSLIIGLVALVCALVAFIPLLGALNWVIVPLAIIGAVVGMLSRGTAGRNLNLFVIVIGIVRLLMGGGIF
jgi:uncharacterized membrane protein